MRTLYITSHGVKVTYKNSKVLITLPTTEKVAVPINALEKLVVVGSASFTSVVLKKLLQYKIPVYFVGANGLYNGQLVNIKSPNLILKELQYKFYFTKSKVKLGLIKNLLLAKIRNSHRLLLRWGRGYGVDRDLLKNEYDNVIFLIKKETQIPRLRGLEGLYAKFYFRMYGRYINNKFGFKSRNKYPPRDPVNSLLSFGYTLLAQDMFSAIASEGLDPYFGFYHKIKYNNPTLVTDLMEEFRAPIVDSLVLDLLKHHKVTKEDFEFKSGGEVLISRKLIKVLISKYQARRGDVYNIEGKSYRYYEIFRLKAKSFKDFLLGKRDNLFAFEIR